MTRYRELVNRANLYISLQEEIPNEKLRRDLELSSKGVGVESYSNIDEFFKALK